MYSKLHEHSFRGQANLVIRHIHKYAGQTSKNPDFHGHTHYMSGYTTEELSHVHYYTITTSPDIEAEEGHFHFYYGMTTIDKKHFHLIYGYTSVHTDY